MVSNQTNFYKTPLPDVWLTICPNLELVQHAISTSNVTFSQVNTALYYCLAAKYLQLFQNFMNISMYGCLCISILGLFGSALIMITLITTKSIYFQSPTFRYFRILIIVQSFVMISFLHSTFRQQMSNLDQKYFAWFFVTTYIEPILNDLFSSWADLIICYLSIERAVACLFPAHFYKLNTMKFFIFICCSTLSLACLCDLPKTCLFRIIYDNQTLVYSQAKDDKASLIAQKGHTIAVLIKCVLLIIATCAAIVGFKAAYRRKMKLQKNLQNTQIQRQQQQIQLEWKITAQLCVLQLAQAMPTIVNNLAIVSMEVATTWISPATIDPTNLAVATGEEISGFLVSCKIFFGVLIFFNTIRVLGHSSHFYLYFGCSKPFRRATKNALASTIFGKIKIMETSTTLNAQKQGQTSNTGLSHIRTINVAASNAKSAWKDETNINHASDKNKQHSRPNQNMGMRTIKEY